MFMKRFRSLLVRQAAVDHAIEAEKRRPAPDNIRLMRLKHLRLRLMEQLRRLAAPPPGAGLLQLAPVRAVRRNPALGRS